MTIDRAGQRSIGSEVLGEAMSVARDIAINVAPMSAALSKRLLKAPFIEELRRVVAEEGQHFVQRLHSPEAHEALSAFTQRRQPDFSKFL